MRKSSCSVIIIATVSIIALLTGCSGSSSDLKVTPLGGSSSNGPAGGSAPFVIPGQPTGPASAPASGSNSGTAPSAKLQSITVQPSDLPSTWTASPYSADPNEATERAAFAQCVGIKDTTPDKVGEAHSDNYAMGDAAISSVATSYQSEADVQSDEAGYLDGDKASHCLESDVRAGASTLPSGTTLDAVTMVLIPGSGGLASNVVGIGRGQVQVTQNGDQVILYEDIAFIKGPMIEAEIDFQSPGQPVDSTLENQLITKVAARAAAA